MRNTGKAIRIGCLLGLLTLVPGIAARADEAETRRQLQAEYERVASALHSGDVSAFTKFWTSDYTEIGLVGETANRDEALEGLRQTLSLIKNAKVSISIEAIKAKGDGANVLANMKASATLTDPQGKGHAMTVDQRASAWWVKTDAGWQERTQIIVQQDVTLDGKPVLPGATQESEALRDELQPKYDVLAAGYNSRSADVLEQMLPKDWSVQGIDGTTQTRQQFLERQKLLIAKGKPSNFSFHIAALATDGEKAVVVYDGSLSAELPDRSGKVQKIVEHTTGREIWVKTTQGWTPQSLQLLYGQDTIDGKPQPPEFATPAVPAK